MGRRVEGMEGRYSADYWRRRAAEAELALAQVTDPSMRVSLHVIVAGYLSLARHAEARQQRGIFPATQASHQISFLHD